jgi:hypothetical protein
MSWSLDLLSASASSPFMDMLAQGLIPSACGGGPCQLCDFYQLAHNIIELLLKIAVPLAIAMMFYGGFLYITSGANPGNLEKGKKSITNAAIGLLIAFGAYAIITSFLLIIGFNMPASKAIDSWNDFPECPRYGELTLVQQCGGTKEGYCAQGSTCQFLAPSGLYSCVPSTALACGESPEGTCPNGSFCAPESTTAENVTTYACIENVEDPNVPTEYCPYVADACADGLARVQMADGTCTCSTLDALSANSKLNEEDAKFLLRQAGVEIKEGEGAPPLDGLSAGAIKGAIALAKSCNCSLVITGGLEEGVHSGAAEGSHLSGDKLDYRLSPSLNNYITSSGEFESVRPRIEKDGSATPGYREKSTGIIYYKEDNHWDVCYVNCRY